MQRVHIKHVKIRRDAHFEEGVGVHVEYGALLERATSEDDDFSCSVELDGVGWLVYAVGVLDDLLVISFDLKFLAFFFFVDVDDLAVVTSDYGSEVLG